MIKQVISEIKQQLQCANIIDCQINEYQLQKLYDGMIDQSMLKITSLILSHMGFYYSI